MLNKNQNLLKISLKMHLLLIIYSAFDNSTSHNQMYKMLSENMSVEHVYTKYFTLDIRGGVIQCLLTWP